MNTLFMSLVSLNGKIRQKTDLEIQSNHSQSSLARSAFTSLLYDACHHGASHLLVCDDADGGTSGPYDDDGESE